MDFFQKKYGLFSDESNLLHNVPSLRKLKDRFPRYVARAEKSQMLGRKIAREVILPKVLELDTKCHKDPSYVDWQLFEELNKRKALTGFVPEKMGALGWSALDCFAFAEESLAACVGITAWYIFNLFGVACSFVEFNPGICVKVLQDMVHAQNAGKPIWFAWSITEPSAGTDAEDPHCHVHDETLCLREESIGWLLHQWKKTIHHQWGPGALCRSYYLHRS